MSAVADPPGEAASAVSICICAGEASGDLHAAELVSAFAALGHHANWWGMGGPRLEAEGVELLVDCRGLAYIGFVDVVLNYRKIVRELHRLEAALAARRPDLIILVDYPGFNLKVASAARALGIPVLYYVSPQIWAWRPQRIKEIARVVDMMAVLFEFEVDIYRHAGVPVRFVGHPLVDEVVVTTSRGDFEREFGLDSDRATIGLLPGSRPGEIKRILPVLLAAAEQLGHELGRVNFVLPVAATLALASIEAQLARTPLRVHAIDGRSYDVINACDAVITSSGTATLETALLGVPMAIVYRLGMFNYLIARRLVRLENIGLVNIVAGREIVPEFVQHEAQPARIAAEIVSLIRDRDRAERMRTDLREVAERLGPGGGCRNVAMLAARMLADSGAAIER